MEPPAAGVVTRVASASSLETGAGRRIVISYPGYAFSRDRSWPEEAVMGANDRLTVLDPTGFAPKITRKELASRLDTLHGKTVYLVDCRFDDSDVFLQQVQAWFAEHMPAVKTVLKPISSVYLNDDPATWEEIKARGHAAIVGVGH
jgi:hypothetical protein